MKEGNEMTKPPVPHFCVQTQLEVSNTQLTIIFLCEKRFIFLRLFCFVFKYKGKELKVYINFFGWNKIPAPKTDEEPISIYGRDIRALKDNTALVNIAFSQQVMTKYATKSAERGMLVKLALSFICERHECRINGDEDSFKVLDDQKCYGDTDECIADLTNTKKATSIDQLKLNKPSDDIKITAHNVNDDEPDASLKLNLLNIGQANVQKEDSDGKQANKKHLIEEITPDEVKTIRSDQSEHIGFDAKVATNGQFYEVSVDLRDAESNSNSSGCELSIACDFLTLNINNCLKKIPLAHLKNQYEIDEEYIEAKLIKKKNVLRIRIPLKHKTM